MENLNTFGQNLDKFVCVCVCVIKSITEYIEMLSPL